MIALTGEPGAQPDRAARALGARFLLRLPVDDRALLDAIDWVTGGPATLPEPDANGTPSPP